MKGGGGRGPSRWASLGFNRLLFVLESEIRDQGGLGLKSQLRGCGRGGRRSKGGQSRKEVGPALEAYAVANGRRSVIESVDPTSLGKKMRARKGGVRRH